MCPTPKQEKFIKLILENIGNTKNTKTFGELLLEAGYSEAISKNPYLILESETIQEGLSSVVDELKKKKEGYLKTNIGYYKEIIEKYETNLKTSI